MLKYSSDTSEYQLHVHIGRIMGYVLREITILDSTKELCGLAKS
jgi:hypothetical protein